MEKSSIIKTVLTRNSSNWLQVYQSQLKRKLVVIWRASISLLQGCEGTICSLVTERIHSTRNSGMTNQYPVRPPRWFNKQVLQQWSVKLRHQELTGLTNWVMLQRVGAKPGQSLQTQVPLQFSKQCKRGLSPHNTLTLQPNLNGNAYPTFDQRHA
jgi:hypothetical protein